MVETALHLALIAAMPVSGALLGDAAARRRTSEPTPAALRFGIDLWIWSLTRRHMRARRAAYTPRHRRQPA